MLRARTPAAAVELAKQYQPAYLVLLKSQVLTDGKSLAELPLEFSPETGVVLVSEDEAPSDGSVGGGS